MMAKKMLHVITSLSAALLFLSVLACGGATDGVAQNEDFEDGCPRTRTPEACDVFGLVNKARVDEGKARLVYNQALAQAAYDHALDMSEQDYFDHTSKDGRTFSQRAKAAGYDAFPSAENIAWGQRNAAEVMDSWMSSSGHRSNILGGSNEIGVGYVDGLWVQVFGKR